MQHWPKSAGRDGGRSPWVLRSTATRLLACQSDAKSEVRIEGEHTIQHTIQTKSDFSGSIVEWKMIPK